MQGAWKPGDGTPAGNTISNLPWTLGLQEQEQTLGII